MIVKGFRFGMLLQLAVGPMCLLVFKTSAANGFLPGFLLVLAIALVDAVYIALSGLGVAALINNSKARLVMKLFGAVVLVLFGMNMILGELGIRMLPMLSIATDTGNQSVFTQGLLLTASDPLTILFWSSVFSAQVIENGLTKPQLAFFGMGCVMSTLAFHTAIDLLGLAAGTFLPDIAVKILNIIVGCALIFFGIRLLLKKDV